MKQSSLLIRPTNGVELDEVGFLLISGKNMLTKETVMRAYAAMMNTLDSSNIELLLADDFHYASQNVFDEIELKKAYMEYINGKLDTIRAIGERILWAEMGTLNYGIPGPCVILAQNEMDNIVAVVVCEIKDDLVSRFDMITVAPSPQSAIRTGEYPT